MLGIFPRVEIRLRRRVSEEPTSKETSEGNGTTEEGHGGRGQRGSWALFKK